MSFKATLRELVHCALGGLLSYALAAGIGAQVVAAEQSAHWSLRPIERPSIPTLRGSKLLRTNPIDTFVLEKLSENKLSLSPPADRHTLIRRLSFDLTGLPPSPGDLRAFERD